VLRVRIESELISADIEADVERLIEIRLDSKSSRVPVLCLEEVGRCVYHSAKSEKEARPAHTFFDSGWLGRTNIAVVIAPSTTGEELTFVFIGIGLLAGILSGVFGIGGGVVIVPALIIVAGLTPIAATGTSLGALLLPVGALGAWEYYRRGDLRITTSLWIALGLFVGAWLGARLAQHLTPNQLRRAFAVFLVLVAGRMWFT